MNRNNNKNRARQLALASACVIESLEQRRMLSATLLKNINPAGDSNAANFTVIGNKLFFTANDGTRGSELWVSDGSPGGTKMVKDINPGSAGSIGPSWAVYATAFDGDLYFDADDGMHGDQLWKSDGTSAGTTMVADIAHGGTLSSPTRLTVAGDRLFFAASDAGGMALWANDGIATTKLVQGPDETWFTALGDVNGTLFATFDDADNHGGVLMSDGTLQGTQVLMSESLGNSPGEIDSDAYGAVAVGNEFYFVADERHLYCMEQSGSMSEVQGLTWPHDAIYHLTAAGGTLYFGVDTRDDSEFWYAGGAYAYQISPTGGFPGGIDDDGSLLYVNGNGILAMGGDGTWSGQVSDMWPNSNILPMSSALYFAADDGTHGNELWMVQRYMAASMVADVNPNGSSNANNVTDFNGLIVFTANDGTHGDEPWVLRPDATPTALPASVSRPDQLNLSWLDPSRSPTDTTISVSTDGGDNFTDLPALGQGVDSYLATDLAPGVPYTFRIVSNYGYDIDGGSISGSITETIDYSWSYNSTSTGQSLVEHQSADSSWSEDGSYASTSDGVTTDGTTSQSDSSTTSSDDLSMSATLVDGAWVWSGTDSGSWADPGSWSYSNTGTYSYPLDGGTLNGTTTSSGGGTWSASSIWLSTIQPDGSWRLASGSATASGDEHDDFTYSGSGDYSQLGGDYFFDGTVTESGGDHTTSRYDTRSSVANGQWQSSGSSSGTWRNNGTWRDHGNGGFSDPIPGGNISGPLNADSSENWNSNGSWGETLGADGKWSLSSGSGTTTNHQQGDNSVSGSGQFSRTVITGDVTDTRTGTASEDADQNYLNDSTINLNVQGGQWVKTGTATNYSSGSGDWSTTGNGSYHRDGWNLGSQWIAGTGQGNEQESWSSDITTNSTLHADGSVTKTGTGNSDDYDEAHFGFSGGGTFSQTYPDGSSWQKTYTESGNIDGSDDVYIDWVLDPNGHWRAASRHITEDGETHGKYDEHNKANGADFTYDADMQEESDYNFDHHLTIATNINGQETRSGSGSGGGSGSGLWTDVYDSLGTDGSNTLNGLKDEYNYQGSWTEDYATGTTTWSPLPNNNQKGTWWQWTLMPDGSVTNRQSGVAYDTTSTGPGFFDHGAPMVGLSFDTFGDPSFGGAAPFVPTPTPTAKAAKSAPPSPSRECSFAPGYEWVDDGATGHLEPIPPDPGPNYSPGTRFSQGPILRGTEKVLIIGGLTALCGAGGGLWVLEGGATAGQAGGIVGAMLGGGLEKTGALDKWLDWLEGN